jgi:hypothetical protein
MHTQATSKGGRTCVGSNGAEDGYGGGLHTPIITNVGPPMLLAAHAIGLGAGPVTSFSKAAVRVILNLPAQLSPAVLVCVGHPAAAGPPPMRPRGRITWQSLTDWEVFPSPNGSIPPLTEPSGESVGADRVMISSRGSTQENRTCLAEATRVWQPCGSASL